MTQMKNWSGRNLKEKVPFCCKGFRHRASSPPPRMTGAVSGGGGDACLIGCTYLLPRYEVLLWFYRALHHILACFISVNFLFPHCPWQQRCCYYKGVKNKVVTLLSFWGLKHVHWWEDSKSGLRLEIRWHLPCSWPHNGRKLAKYPIVTAFDRFFCPKLGSNFIPDQFWDQVWNPLIKAHLLDPKMKGGIIPCFWPPIVMSKL